jgi:DNA helicase II / ATP-dependent DNA helicase PcrA
VPAIQLSGAQQQVVAHRGSDLQIVACAGAGKTEAISRRIAALIAEGTEPEAIVAFTFTERAAGELKNRVAQRVLEQVGPSARDSLGRMFIGTIHGYCFRLLQDHVPRFGNYDVLDEHRHAGLLSREFYTLGLNELGGKHWASVSAWVQTVDVIGNELIPEWKLAGTKVGGIYTKYRELLDRYHLLTFGLIIARAVEALQDVKVFQRVTAPLRYLFVDEFQDVNPAQERLIDLLSSEHVELCVVGDDDQAIYQFRGSDVTPILEFTTRRPGASRITLDENRRSRPAIVSRANAFAQTIPGRLDKQMQPVRPASGPQFVHWTGELSQSEVETIADTIVQLYQQGVAYRDIAVLYRSVRTSAPPLLEALERRGVPFVCGGRTGLFLQPDVALFGELFAWMVDGDWRDAKYAESRPASLDNVVSGLEREFNGGSTIPRLKTFLEDWKKFHERAARPVSLIGDLYRILSFIGAAKLDPQTPVGATRLGSLGRLSNVLADFEHVTRRARYKEENGGIAFRGGRDRGKEYFTALHRYLLHYAQGAYEDWSGDELTATDSVDVLTVHQAKGLEWPIVFVPALVSGRFPSRKAGSKKQWLLDDDLLPQEVRKRYEGGDAEERRLFYVALTRARECVYLTRFGKHDVHVAKPSPYFEQSAEGWPAASLPLPLTAAQATVVGEATPLDVSLSDIAVFEECGHRYRLATVFGFQQELALELGYGKAIHHVLRTVAELSRETGTIPDSATLEVLLEREFYLPFANAAAFSRMSQSARRLVNRYVEEHAEDLARIWAVERPFELNLPGGRVAGRADVILDREGGKTAALAIVDYKVANNPAYDERYRRQLAVYAAAARGEGLNVRAGYLHELKDGARHPVDVGQHAAAQAVVLLNDTVDAIRQGKYLPTPEPSKCKGCDYRVICGHSAAIA